MPTAKTFSVRLPEDVRDNVDRLAKVMNRSRSFIINEAVQRHTNERLAYLKELDEAVAAIETEPTYHMKDVRAWVQTWGTDDEKPLSEVSIPLRS